MGGWGKLRPDKVYFAVTGPDHLDGECSAMTNMKTTSNTAGYSILQHPRKGYLWVADLSQDGDISVQVQTKDPSIPGIAPIPRISTAFFKGSQHGSESGPKSTAKQLRGGFAQA